MTMATDFSHFFDLSLDLLATIGPDGRFQELNPAWEDVTGRTPQELRGAVSLDFIHPDDLPGVLDRMSRVAGSMRVLHYESRFRCKDETYKWLAWTTNFEASDNVAYCIARDVTPYKDALAERDRSLAEMERLHSELVQRQEHQQQALSAMGTPIIQIWDHVVTLPIVGVVDSTRASEMKEALLQTVARTGARIAIVDMTGVDTVDTATADHIVRLMQGVQLLGAQGIITGIQPAVAQIMVHLGVNVGGVMTLRSLREALRYSIRAMGYRVVATEA